MFIALNSLVLGAQPFWPQDFYQKYGTKAIVKGHQYHTKHTGFACVLYLSITSVSLDHFQLIQVMLTEKYLCFNTSPIS